jgi:hypothetical protein
LERRYDMVPGGTLMCFGWGRIAEGTPLPERGII